MLRPVVLQGRYGALAGTVHFRSEVKLELRASLGRGAYAYGLGCAARRRADIVGVVLRVALVVTAAPRENEE
jgi:hypothetical protein